MSAVSRWILFRFAAAALSYAHVAQATEPASDPASAEAKAEETEAAAWSFSLAAATYIVPHTDVYEQPTLMADHEWLHLEGRFNYEALDTASLWLGYNFSIGDTLTLDFTPMIGGAFGDVFGVAPGARLTLGFWKLDLYSEARVLVRHRQPHRELRLCLVGAGADAARVAALRVGWTADQRVRHRRRHSAWVVRGSFLPLAQPHDVRVQSRSESANGGPQPRRQHLKAHRSCWHGERKWRMASFPTSGRAWLSTTISRSLHHGDTESTENSRRRTSEKQILDGYETSASRGTNDVTCKSAPPP